MASQRDVRNRIDSVKNIQKITRAMQMVAAARLRRAEQRIEQLRPYADAIRVMTRQAAEASENLPNVPIMFEHSELKRVGLLLVTADRGLAGAFNSQILRAGLRVAEEYKRQGIEVDFYASGRRGVSSLSFRGYDLKGEWIGFTDRPAYADARRIADALTPAYVDEKVDRVEMIYNGYISALNQEVRRQTLLPLQEAAVIVGDEDRDEAEAREEERERERVGEREQDESGHSALVEYEPEPEELLGRLIPDYVEISIFRALLESTASEHGARMTAMRNASENAGELIDDLTLEMNRARQAEITQEILEVVAGADALGG
jgi:F-type H+-transporting ATPase subunit gamma